MTKVNIVTSFNENLLKNTTHYLLTSLQENLDPKKNLLDIIMIVN